MPLRRNKQTKNDKNTHTHTNKKTATIRDLSLKYTQTKTGKPLSTIFE
jgi:hypothetical protein